MLKKDPKAKDGCRAPKPGEIMKNPTLANTFRLLAKDGKKGFYEGEVAEALVKVVQDLGGHFTLEDLKNHMALGSEEVDAISLKFNGQGVGKLQAQHMHDSSEEGVELWEHPPNGQGVVALMALGILQELEKMAKVRQFREKDHNSAEYASMMNFCLPTMLMRLLGISTLSLKLSASPSPTQTGGSPIQMFPKSLQRDLFRNLTLPNELNSSTLPRPRLFRITALPLIITVTPYISPAAIP